MSQDLAQVVPAFAADVAVKRLGSPQVVLSTAHRDAAGQRLFESLGFQPTMLEMTLQFSEATR
jgi:ribosomal protein S18 acetylase RimI-like enzyme